MAMVVKNNMSAVRTLNTLNSNTSALQKSLQKVSSGMKINSAQDDASGYAISERMRVRIRSLDQANQNSQNDSSLMKTAEGAVGNTVEILRALKEKAINAANDSNTDEDRQTIQKEINQFIDQIDDNALVQFNGKYLVDGSKNNAFKKTKSILLNQSLQIGTRSSSALTDLANRAGDSLGIQSTDHYQVSWVQNGTIHFTSGRVSSNAISDILTLKSTDGSTDISQVAATTKQGLIAAADEVPDENNTPYNNGVAFDKTNLESAGAKEIIAAVEDAITNSKSITSGGVAGTATAGNPIDISSLKDAAGNMLFAKDSDGTKIAGTITKAAAGTTPPYEFSTTVDATDKIYHYNKEYTDPTVYSYADVLTYATNGVSTVSNKEPFKDLTTTGVLLSSLDASKFADLPEGATNAQWYVTNGSGNAVDASTIYVGKVANGNVVMSASNGLTGDSAYNGYKIQVKYTPKSSGAEENGLSDAWDKFGKAVYTPDKTEGIAFGATTAGVNDQISGLTINILDQDGNVKKAANAALDQFKQYQRAENETGDMSLNFHIGSEANVAFKVGMGDMRAQALGLKGSDGTRIDVFTKEHANAAINVIENALTKALDQQTTIGAIEARLEYTSTNLTTSSENVQAAESTIRDADMAKEMTNYTKSNVLLQAAQAMLAQANQNSSAVLSLLQ